MKAEMVSENNISVDRDFAGTLHIKVGDFDYIQIQYKHPYTDNASTRALADRIVSLLAQPVEADSFQIARHSKRLVEQLRSEAEVLRKDAERYRAFRQAGLPNGLGVYDAKLDDACDELAAEQREGA